MQIEISDVVKIATLGTSLGGGFAFFKPFATQLFTWWLERLKERALIADGKERALERIAIAHERTVGVLESVDKRMDRLDVRLDRLEAHHGISPTPSAIPSVEHTEKPRRQLTDPDMRPVGPLPAPQSPPASSRG